MEFLKKLEENTNPRRSPGAISTEKGRKRKSEELDVDFEEWKNLSKEEKFGIAAVQSSFKSRMSAVKLKEYEDYKDEPRTILNRKQNDGPSRQNDMIASKTRHEKLESENKSTRICTPVVDFNVDEEKKPVVIPQKSPRTKNLDIEFQKYKTENDSIISQLKSDIGNVNLNVNNMIKMLIERLPAKQTVQKSETKKSEIKQPQVTQELDIYFSSGENDGKEIEKKILMYKTLICEICDKRVTSLA